MAEGSNGHGKLLAGIAAGVVVLLAAAGGGAYVLLRTHGTPQRTATAFVAAWERGDTTAMRRLVVAPPSNFAASYAAFRHGLGVRGLHASITSVHRHGDGARAAFSAGLRITAVGHWRYTGHINLVKHDRKWLVHWSPATIHPRLADGRELALRTRWPSRGAIRAADGSRLDGPGASGSEQEIAGSVGPATTKDLHRLGAPYRPGVEVGHGGIQQRLQDRLAGRPTTRITVIDAKSRKALAVVGQATGKPGGDVHTGLDPKIQQAAARAIIGEHKPTALVAIRPSSGVVLAAANKPGGFNRALVGRYPPGSTFKVVTATALERAGVRPTTRVNCPKSVDEGGLVVHNAEHEHFGAISFRTAFAKSCNTAFAGTTAARLTGSKLVATARDLGFDARPELGLSASLGHVPNPHDKAELAASSFGQGKVSATPLQMATVAAAVDNGTWRPPRMVLSPAQHQHATSHRLPSSAVSDVRSMMRSVVTSGTAAHSGLPGGTYGKTGTAEYGNGPKPPTHAWFIGYRGDLAFAVVVEGGGFGGKVAVPIAAKFLKTV